MTEKKVAKKTTQGSAKRTPASKSETFSAEERAAMNVRAQELKAEARANRNKADGERDVLAAIDKGAMWPVAFALKELTAAEQAKITALVKKAAS